MNRLVPVLSLLLALLLPASLACAGGWVDDWLQQKTSTSATYFDGQKRGYYSAGSFSARWPNQQDYLVTVQPPRLSGGCGGIDLFAGGLSFMNFDYLVEKLQRVLQNGGVVAFELALNTLCPECVNVINNVENMANSLNSMQLDECGAAKKLVATLKTDGDSLAQTGRDLATSIKNFDLNKGIGDLYTRITEDHTARKGALNPTENKRIMEGCPQEIKDIYFNNFGGGSSSLLQNLGVAKMGLNQTYTDAIRGLVGDIVLEIPENGYAITFVPPCPENAGDDSKHMLDGKALAKNTAGNCYLPTNVNGDLVKYFQDEMSRIATRIRDKQALSTEQSAFLQSSPLSLGLVLKTAVGTEMEGATITTMADITAKAHALQMLSDLYHRAQTIGDRGQAVLKQKSSPVAGQDPSACAAELFERNFSANVDKMLDRIYKLQDGAKKSYAAATQETALILGVVDHLRQGNERLKGEVAKRFSPALANQLFNN